MRDSRTIGLVASTAVVAVVAVIVGALLHGKGRTPSAAAHQTGAAKERSVPPKDMARILAPTTLNYYRPKVALDGALKTDKHTFHLYGADVLGREYTCTYRNGQRWACGLRSYVALLNLVGSQPIECHPKNARNPDIVICHQGNIDLSEWMLEHGWARLAKGVTAKRYVEAAEAAEAAQVGMWTPAPQPQQNVTAQ